MPRLLNAAVYLGSSRIDNVPTETLDLLTDGRRLNIEMTQRTPIDILTPSDSRENGIIAPSGLVLEEVLDIVPEGLELVLCQSDARALGKPSAVAQSNDKTKNILAMRSACVRVARSTPDGTPPPGLRSHS